VECLEYQKEMAMANKSTIGQVTAVLSLIGMIVVSVIYVQKYGTDNFAPKSVEAQIKKLPELYAQKSTEKDVLELRYERDIRDLEQRKFSAEQVYQGQPMPPASQQSYDKLKRDLEEAKDKKKALYK